MLKLGEFEIIRVVESEAPFLPLDTFLPDADPEVVAAHRDWLFPRFVEPGSNRIIIAIQSYVLRTPRKTILVDTCVGNDKPRPGRPMFDHLNTTWLADLAAAGVQPEEVDGKISYRPIPSETLTPPWPCANDCIDGLFLRRDSGLTELSC